MPRPRRSATEQIEDAFADLSLPQQGQMLEDLARLHRWCKRERGKATEKPAADQPEPPAGNADQAANGAAAE